MGNGILLDVFEDEEGGINLAISALPDKLTSGIWIQRVKALDSMSLLQIYFSGSRFLLNGSLALWKFGAMNIFLCLGRALIVIVVFKSCNSSLCIQQHALCIQLLGQICKEVNFMVMWLIQPQLPQLLNQPCIFFCLGNRAESPCDMVPLQPHNE